MRKNIHEEAAFPHLSRINTELLSTLKVCFLILIGSGLFVGQASASQALIGMPLTGKWAYNALVSPPYTDSNSSHPSVHHTPGGGDWATDVYAAEGTAVKLDVTYPTSGVTFSWKTTSTTCGQSTGVNVIVAGTTVGWLYFAHLNSAVTSGTITNGMTLGTVHDWGGCNPGVHVHIESKNSSNYSCYVDNGQPGVTLNYGANFGVLDSSNSGAQQACASVPTNTPRISNATGYDGDSYSDLGLIQKTSDGGMGVSAAYGNYGTPFQTVQGLRTLPGTAGWDWTKVKIASGYFNSDSYKDIALVHQLSDDGADIHILYGGSTPFSYTTTFAKHLLASDGWHWSQLKVDAGDYNADGYSDLALVQKNSDGGMGVSIAYGSSGTPFQTVQGVRTLLGSDGWSWDKVKLASGRFNSDAYEDLALLHQLPDDGMDIHILYGGSTPFSYTTTFAKNLPASDGWQWSNLKIESGNYNGDGYSDLALVQKSSDGGMGVSIAYGNYGTPFQTVQGVRTLPASSGWSYDKVLLSSGYYNSDDYEDLVMVHGLSDDGADLHVLYGGYPPFSYSTTFAKHLLASDGWQWSLLKVE